MVVDLELRRSNLGHFDKFDYQVRQQADGTLSSRHHLHSTAWVEHSLDPDSVISSIADSTGALSTETFDTDIGMTPVVTRTVAPRMDESSWSSSSVSGSCDSFRSLSPVPEGGILDAPAHGFQYVRHFPISDGTIAGDRLVQNVENQTQPSSFFVSTSSVSTKRRRATHDVDGPWTGHLSCKKRRLRLQLITSRLSQPFSLPATHILNRESDEDTPVISRFVKLAALRAKRAGHQTSLVRKAAILNRVRLNVRQAAVTRGHDRMWRLAGLGVMSHGLQLVTDSTGAMFPGRSGEQVPGPIVPRAWRPHTTAASASVSTGQAATRHQAVQNHPRYQESSLGTGLAQPPHQTLLQDAPPPTSIMTPLAGADDEEASFPDLDSRYADTDDDMDGVYADFGALFGGGACSPEDSEEEEHFYEEYLDEVDGIIWAS
ncbi:hypothetical protein SCUP515_03381 [Seiridium cupressi]